MEKISRLVRFLSCWILILAVAAPSSWGCACGCGVFDVGTSALMPTRPGGLAYLEFDSMNQNRNWSGRRRASDDANPDKQIRTEFFNGGVQYMVDRSWGFMVDVPVWARHFTTTDESGNIAGFDHTDVGDVRVRGVYAGFSGDMSSGLTFGFKLPTGSINTPDFDRDTQIGTGSTDVLLGAYHAARLEQMERVAWFTNVQGDEPVISAGGYRPGAELDATVGAYFDGWRVGDVKLAPLAQLVGSIRWRDSGVFANSPDTGYRRLIIAPGIEARHGDMRIYGDVGFPVYQFMNGNQLTAGEYFKLNVGWSF